MIKYFIVLSSVLILYWGCSSSKDLSDLSPEDRLKNAINLYNQEDYEEAAIEFEALLLQYPGSSIVDDAQYYFGMCKFHRGEYILAAYEFSKLVRNMPASEFAADGQFMLAECYYELSPNFNLDQKYTKKAIEEFQAFIDFFPLNAKVSEAEKKISELNEKLARKEYTTAIIYEKLEYYTAAIKYFDSVIETYHDTPFAPMAMYRKILLLVERERNAEALTEAKKFIRMFPDDENFQQVDKLKNSLEEKLKGNLSFN